MNNKQRNPFGFEIFDMLFTNIDDLFNNVGESSQVRELYPTSFPPSNVKMRQETKDLIFEFALAGYGEEDIDLSFDGDKMYLELKKLVDVDDEDIKCLQKGIKTSSQKGWYFVPFAKYDTSNAVAEMKNGILKVEIPFKEEAKPKKIKIKLLT